MATTIIPAKYRWRLGTCGKIARLSLKENADLIGRQRMESDGRPIPLLIPMCTTLKREYGGQKIEQVCSGLMVYRIIVLRGADINVQMTVAAIRSSCAVRNLYVTTRAQRDT